MASLVHVSKFSSWCRCARPERCGRERTEKAIFLLFRSFFVAVAFLEKWHGRCVIVGSAVCTLAGERVCTMQKSNAVRALEAKPYGRRCNQTEIRESIFNYTHYVRRSFAIRSPCVHLTHASVSIVRFTLFSIPKLFIVQLVDVNTASMTMAEHRASRWTRVRVRCGMRGLPAQKCHGRNAEEQKTRMKNLRANNFF